MTADFDDDWEVTVDNIFDKMGWGTPTKCECGAVYTANPNLHSRWCPQFKEYK